MGYHHGPYQERGRQALRNQCGWKTQKWKQHTLGDFFNKYIHQGIGFLCHHPHVLRSCTPTCTWICSGLFSRKFCRCNVSIDFAMIKQL